MAKKVKLTGLNEVLKNLNKEIENIEGDTFDGIKAAGLFIKGEAVERAPVEFGVLRNSAFAQTERRTKGPVSTVGFTAKYAPYVHEAPMKLKGRPRAGAKGVYWQGGENKFLEKAIKFNVADIISIVAKRAKI